MNKETATWAYVLHAAMAEGGAQALSRPALLGNLCADLAPDTPNARHLLGAAAEFDVAANLISRLNHGLATSTAIAMVADAFARQRFFQTNVSIAVVTEFARALGYDPDVARTPLPAEPAIPHTPPAPRAPGARTEAAPRRDTLGVDGAENQPTVTAGQWAPTAPALVSRPPPRRRRLILGAIMLVVIFGVAFGATFIATQSNHGSPATTEAGGNITPTAPTATTSTTAQTTTTLPPASVTAPSVTVTTAPPSTNAAIRTGAGTTAVPVISCPFQSGVTGATAPALPNQVNEPSAVASDVTPFSDGWLTGLAPGTWACSGLLAGDGGRSLTMTPAGQSTSPPFGPTAEAVTIYLPSEGTNPAMEVACGYFTGADASGFCSDIAPVAGEKTYQANTETVLFEDPPGVNGYAGNGSISGGDYPANGVIIYNAAVQYGAVATCTLPDAQHALCTAILNDFLGRYQNPGG